MARVTVEDCMKIVENRFELVICASQRAKDIASGARLTIARNNDKNPVIALREIAQNTVDHGVLKEMAIRNLQKRNKFDNIEDEQESNENLDNDDIMEMEFLDDINISFSSIDDDDDDSISFVDENIDLDD